MESGALECYAVAAPEVAALLRDPPEWLDLEAPHDTELSPLSSAPQRAQVNVQNAGTRLEWRWECSVRVQDASSAFAGEHYRVVVRIPTAYPRVPPRLNLLSIVHHLEVELRDPFEGEVEDSFYETLSARAGGPPVADLVSGTGPAPPGKRPLRFSVGQRVLANVGRWAPGRITRLWYSEDHEGWPEGKVVPYQVLLDDGRRVFAPADHDRVIRAAVGADDEYVQLWSSYAESHRENMKVGREYPKRCLHPALFDTRAGPQRDWFAPSFASAFDAGEPDAATLRSLVREVAPGVYAFEMLSHSFCAKLLEELKHYEACGLPVRRPNSMNNYGVILNSVGLERMMDLLQRRYVRPLAAALFPVEGENVDHHHSFMVQYRADEDLGLDMHTDACDVTLNVCLGLDFTGAGLTFCGLRGDVDGEERRFSYRHTHVKGHAILHLGHHRHGADDITSGERYNLIMWSKSSSFRVTKAFGDKNHKPSDRGVPDLVCLSYTHDSDFETYKPYPPGKRPKPNTGGG